MKLYLRYFICLFISCCLTSCAVGPDFVRPAAPADQTYSAENHLDHFGSQYINQQKNISPVWWQEFNYPELNIVVEQGVKNSYTLVSMQETLKQAEEMVNAARGQLWPQIALDASVGRQKYGVALFGPIDISIPPYTYYEIGPSLSYMLDVFGSTRRTIERQQALAVYQKYEWNAAYLSLTGNIAVTALTIATLNAQLETTKQIIYEDKKNLNLVQQSFNLGSATKVEVLSTKSQLDNDETLLPPLRQQLTEAENTLNVLVGSAPANWIPPHFTLRHFTLPRELPLVLPSALVHTRPDILAAEATLHAASAAIGIATANLYPNINITASTFQEALLPANLFKASANAWGYSNYQQVVLKAFGQVNNVLHALKHDEEELIMQKHAVQTAKYSLQLARLSYKEGNSGVLQILDSERLYNQAQIGYVKAKGQRYQDTVQLYLVLGGGHVLS
jgi:NodT family efflux transporter outer membrane factor (OMF) lipoprotein